MTDSFVRLGSENTGVVLRDGKFLTTDRATLAAVPDQYAHIGGENVAIRVRNGALVTCDPSYVGTITQYAHLGSENAAITVRDGCIVAGVVAAGTYAYIHLGDPLPLLVLRGGVVVSGFAASTYDDIVMRIPDWLVYHRVTESAAPILDYSGHGYNATWIGTPQLAQIDGPGSTMGKAARCSGDDSLSYYNAAIAAVGSPGAFNPQEFGFFLWLRSIGAWSGRFVGFRVDPVDGSNRVLMYAPSATQLSVFYAAGGTPVAVVNTVSQDAWHCVGMTVSKSNNRMRMWVDGVKVGSDQVVAGVWAGSINANCMCWFSETSSPLGSPYTGYGYRCGIISGHEPTAAECLTIATPI